LSTQPVSKSAAAAMIAGNVNLVRIVISFSVLLVGNTAE
jgi:hypothetical protein